MDLNPQIMIAQEEYQKILPLLNQLDTEASELLLEELGRATIVPQEKMPADIVRMNSKVTFQNLETHEESEITLVYPQDADVESGKISLLAPIGSALIGLRIGQEIEWPLPNGKVKKVKVMRVET